ncbi:MAG: hypothetical protein ETSY1_44330 [Candidatus Entotheonella factor]|uniref:ISKra4 family transposase n=1 Tax=Entotheonella factor TaxID=1429438 RepID=W4L3R6_ENTF1|nr:MAG: hypothetical protein ETSY1_44330 [Candidatus Entotheonella factor]
MLCLGDSLRHDDPAMQPFLAAIGQAQSLSALVIAAWTLAQSISVQIVESVLAERAQYPTIWPNCPQCGKRLHSKGLVKREVATLVGMIRWRRRVGRCPDGCAIGQIAPFDATLGVTPHQRASLELQALGCAFAVFVPFATAAHFVSWCSGVSVSSWAVWQWVQVAGTEAMKRLESQLEALETGVEPEVEPMAPELADVPLALSGDGVMVPLRPHGGRPEGKIQWREVKVGVLARLRSYRNRRDKVVTRLAQRRLVAVLGEIDEFKVRFWYEALRQGIRRAKTVVWLSDGGRGYWGLYDEFLRGYGQGILDFYHAAQNLWKGAAAWLDGRTKQARQWFGCARHWLRHGHLDSVLGDLSEALEVETLPGETRKTLEKVYAYLVHHQDHLDYATYKDQGLPLGSGMVESACKWLIQQRFKGVGMRWSAGGFNHLLHLRLAWVNGTFGALFEPIETGNGALDTRPQIASPN